MVHARIRRPPNPAAFGPDYLSDPEYATFMKEHADANEEDVEDADDEDYVFEEEPDDPDDTLPVLFWRDRICPCDFKRYCLYLSKNHPATLPTVDLQNDWYRHNHKPVQFFTTTTLSDALATMPSIENLFLPITKSEINGQGWEMTKKFVGQSKTLRLLSLKSGVHDRGSRLVPTLTRALVDDLLRACLQNEGVKELRLWAVSFNPSLLAELVRNNRLTHLEVGFCRFHNSDGEGVRALCFAFAVNTSLKSLSIVCVGWEYGVLHAIKNHPRLENLDISIRNRTGAYYLRSFLESTCSLKTLHFQNTLFECTMIGHVVEGLKANRTVTDVEVSGAHWNQSVPTSDSTKPSTPSGSTKPKSTSSVRRYLMRTLVAMPELRSLKMDMRRINSSHRACMALVQWRTRSLDLLREEERDDTAGVTARPGLIYPRLFAKLGSLATHDGHIIGPTVLFSMLREAPTLVVRSQNQRRAKRVWTGARVASASKTKRMRGGGSDSKRGP